MGGACPLGQRRTTRAATSKSQRSAYRLGADIPVRLAKVQVAGAEVFMLLPNDEAVMDMYIEAGLGDRDPYWVEPWPSAFFLAAELAARPELVAGKAVAELGCGIGLGGAAAAASGASSVLLLDREPLALQCALLNAALRGQRTAPPPAAAAPLPELLPLLQAAHAAAVATAGNGPPPPPLSAWLLERAALASAISGGEGCLVSAALYDWGQPPALRPVDVLLACDVLYEDFSVEPVARVAQRLVKRAGGRLLLADPPNRTPHNRERFLELLCGASGGFVVEECGERCTRGASASSPPLQFMVLRRTLPGDTVGLKP